MQDLIAQIKENRQQGLILSAGVMFLMLAFFSFYPWPALIGSLSAAVLITLAVKPEIGLYGMVLFLPAIHWDFFYRGLDIPLIDLIGLTLAVSFFIRSFYLFLSNRESFKKLALPLLAPFLFFLAAAVISDLLSNNQLADLWYSARWILFFYLVYIAVPFNIINSKRVLRNVIILFAAVSLITAMMGFWSLTMQDWHNEFVRIKPLGWNTFYPLGQNQNLLAEIWLVGIFFILSLRQWFGARFGRIANLLAILLSLALLGTFSLAGWIVLFIQAAIYVFYLYKKFAMAMILSFITLLIILSPMVYYMVRLRQDYQIGVSSLENRVLLSQISWQAFLDRPWFGQGSGEFINLVDNNIRFRAKYGPPIDSHGVWQKILAENGLAGVLTFAVFSWSIFYYLFFSLKKHKAEVSWLLPLIIGSSGIFLFEFFNTSYYKGKIWLPIAVVLAAVNLIKQNKYGQAKN